MLKTSTFAALAALTAASTGMTLRVPPAQAGRFCADRVEGGAATGASEAEARTAAQSWWSSRAGALGRGYEDWSAAEDKRVECQEKNGGHVRCVASARPCLPEGVLPNAVPKLEM